MARSRALTRSRGGRYGTMATAGAAAYGIRKYFPPTMKAIGRGFRNFKTEMSQGGARVMSNAPVTFQHDTKVTYRRKSAPKRVKRMARKSAQRFEKNMSTLLGCKRLVINDYASIATAANSQSFRTLSFCDNTDIARAFALYSADAVPGTANFNFNNAIASELLFRNIRMEVELRNNSSDLAYIDLYYWYPRKDMPVTVDATIAQGFGLTGDQNSGTFQQSTGAVTFSANVATTNMGLTPFDYPAFTENFVIYKTRRINLAGNQSCSFDMKSKPRNQSSKDWIGQTYRRNISSGVIIIVSGAVNGTGDGSSATNISIHRQLWATLYRQGGKGPVSQTFVQTLGTTP